MRSDRAIDQVIARLNVRQCDWTWDARAIVRSIVRRLERVRGGMRDKMQPKKTTKAKAKTNMTNLIKKVEKEEAQDLPQQLSLVDDPPEPADEGKSRTHGQVWSVHRCSYRLSIPMAKHGKLNLINRVMMVKPCKNTCNTLSKSHGRKTRA